MNARHPFGAGDLPDDPALPQLRRALDAGAMAAEFDRVLRPQGGLQVVDCRIERAKYRPRRNCQVSYLLELSDPRRDELVEQRVVARFCAEGAAARRHARALAGTLRSTPAGPRLLYLPALEALAHCWPNDPKLDAPALFDHDAALRTRCLPAVVDALTGGRGRLIEHRTSIVQYVPEHRLCARIDLRMQPAPGEPPAWQRLYAKADAARCGARAHEAMRALRASPAARAGRLRTPRSILWQGEAGVHWQAGVAGRALLDLAPAESARLSARLGATLAALHATPLPQLPALGAAKLVARAHAVAATLAVIEPAWQPVLERLVRALDAGAWRVTAGAPVSLHGDLHPRNVLVEHEQLAFVDLDDALRGPALVELGAWSADALYRAALAGTDGAAALPALRDFVAAYAEAAGGAVDETGLAWSTAWNLVCVRAWRCAINLKPGRYALVPQLLALARALLSEGSLDGAAARGRVAEHA